MLLLDACSIINLYTTGRMDAIIDEEDSVYGMVSSVQQEALAVRRGGSGEDAREFDPIDLSGMISRGALHVVVPTEAELAVFVEISQQLGDGEALSVAVALARGYAIVTDDRIAVRVIAGRVPVYPSLGIIKAWVERQHLPRAAITAMLRDLRQRGSYVPGRNHQLRPWWDQYLGNG